MHALAMLSYTLVKHLGNTRLEARQVRRRMQEGVVADITVFGARKVTVNMTFEKWILPSTGIAYVIISGVVMIKESQVFKNVDPGKPIRFEPETGGRFTPLSIEAWKTDYLGAPMEFCQRAGTAHHH